MRDNRQSGPYTLEQLKSLSLEPNDLVWVQGRSENWTYAGEIEELKDIVGTESASNPRNESPSFRDDRFTSAGLTSFPSLETKYTRPLDEIKEMYVDHLQKSNKTRWYKTALAVSVMAVLVLAGILIKRSMAPEQVEIKDVAIAPPGGEAVTNSENFQNALSKEFIPIEPKPKKIKPKELKKMVSVQVNDYQVKILGGIKDLEITVQNFSEHLLDDVTVKVDYLKPKGEIINSEMITISGIKAGDSKTIQVPPSSRGMKIKYAITEVKSKEYKAVLEEL